MENGHRAATPTSEELEIVQLLAAGWTDEAVARQLGLARRTYRRRLQAAMEKLGAHSRFQAGARAAARGWLRANEDRDMEART